MRKILQDVTFWLVSMMTEILEGRGCGEQGDHVFLKLDHLGKEILHSRLPGITELSKTFAHVDPVNAPIPVVPTCSAESFFAGCANSCC